MRPTARKGKIQLPDGSEPLEFTGDIIAVGEGRPSATAEGGFEKMPFEVGEKVLFGPHAGTVIGLPKPNIEVPNAPPKTERLYLLYETEVLARVEEGDGDIKILKRTAV